MKRFVPFIAVLLAACTNVPPPVVTNTEVVKIIHPPLPSKVQMREVKWQVYNREQLIKLLDETSSTDEEIVIFALTDNGYENLSVNVQELRRYILEQQEIIKYYRSVLKEGEPKPKQQ
jgi:hypothetical protein